MTERDLHSIEQPVEQPANRLMAPGDWFNACSLSLGSAAITAGGHYLFRRQVVDTPEVIETSVFSLFNGAGFYCMARAFIAVMHSSSNNGSSQ